MEDKIKYERQPEIGSDDALSISEWKKLSNYAKERNIEISPLIQGLGHASFSMKNIKIYVMIQKVTGLSTLLTPKHIKFNLTYILML